MAAHPGMAPSEYGPWNPGIESQVPEHLRHLCTIFRPENVFTSLDHARELCDLTGLELADVTAFRPQRGRLRLAIWLRRLGLRDYRHVFGTARTYHHHWRRSGGRCDGVTATAPRSELTEAARSR